jgi:PAS domain S-box-containing protein
MKLDTKELKNITVLYVEDNDMVRSQTEKIFNKLFKKSYVGVDGVEGFKLYQDHMLEIDVIVTDINMPNLSGLDMIKKINKYNNSIATIVTTAHSDSDNLLKAIDINIDKYITKPIQIKELTVSIVDLVLKYRRINNMEDLAKSLVQKTTLTDKENNELNYELEITKKQNHFFKVIIDHLVINFKTDKNGNITDISSKFKIFFGYDDSILGKNLKILQCTSCTQESFQKLMLKAIHTKKTVIATYTFKTNKDRKVEAEVTMTPSYGEDGLVNGYTFYLDII